MNAYSKDLGLLRVLGAVDRGLPRKEVADLFGISLSTIERYLKLRREGRGLAPRPSSPGRTTGIILATDEDERALWAQLEANDEATLERRCELWERKRGVRVSVPAMSRATRTELGWTRKKRRRVPPSARRGLGAPGGSARAG